MSRYFFQGSSHWASLRWTQLFILPKLIKLILGFAGDLVVKSKLFTHSGSAALICHTFWFCVCPELFTLPSFSIINHLPEKAHFFFQIQKQKWQSTKSQSTNLHPFQANVSFLYPLKTSENLWFSDVFRAYRKGALAQNGLIQTSQRLDLD